jgi:hypothetical protein
MEKKFKVQIYSPNGTFWTYIGAHTSCVAYRIAVEMYPYPKYAVGAVHKC